MAGVLKSTIILCSKLIFKILFPLQMVQTNCQVICPHFSAQQARRHCCIKQVEGGGHLHQQGPAPAHSPCTKGISAIQAALPCFSCEKNTAPEQGQGAEQAGGKQARMEEFSVGGRERKAWEKSPHSLGLWKPLATGQTSGSLLVQQKFVYASASQLAASVLEILGI